MSGSPRCAIAAPSRKRTSPCTIDVGWTTTSMCSYGRPKRKCASITSSPLFASVAESIVIFGPIDHVGCASASSGVTSASSSRVRPRNGPPLAVSTTLSGSPSCAHWKSAECSLSTGSSRPPPRRRAATASSPAATRLSLFASASVTPRSSAHIVAGSPANPRVAFRTTSGSARSRSAVGSPPTCVCGASPSIAVEPLVAATSSSSGRAPITSSAWRPIEPVAPSSATRVMDTVCPLGREGQDREIGRRGGEQERVQAIEHAAVPAEEVAAVLDARVPLEQRLEQIAHRPGDRQHGAERDRLADRQEVLLVERHERDENGRGGPEHEALPRLPGRHRGRHLVPPDEPAAEVREGVAGPSREQHRDEREPTVLRQVSEEEEEGEAAADPQRAHHGWADSGSRRRTRLGDRFEQEREREGRKDPTEHPDDPGELGADQPEGRPDVPGGRERCERARHQPVLVQRHGHRDRDKREDPPAAEVDRSEHHRQQHQRDDDARGEGAHLPPNLRRRDAYSASAARRWLSSKSGQNVSTNTSSV